MPVFFKFSLKNVATLCRVTSGGREVLYWGIISWNSSAPECAISRDKNSQILWEEEIFNASSTIFYRSKL